MGWSAALVADLLFGSRLQGALGAAGVDVELVASADRLAEAIRERTGAPEVLIVDLSDPELPLEHALAALGGAPTGTGADLGGPRGQTGAGGGAGAGGDASDPGAPTRTLGFYSHVHPEQRALGERAGLDVVVPRSRLAREAAALVQSLLAA